MGKKDGSRLNIALIHPDLGIGPGATIGGMCATRCSGSLAVRYGTMRENVISLKMLRRLVQNREAAKKSRLRKKG